MFSTFQFPLIYRDAWFFVCMCSIRIMLSNSNIVFLGLVLVHFLQIMIFFRQEGHLLQNNRTLLCLLCICTYKVS
jgi:hypothetical protein